MFLIGEISKISQVSLRMLRYYDKNNIFKPRIINEENGYRYYTADQLDELYQIIELRDLGFTVAEITDFLKKEMDEREVLLKEKERELEEQLREIKKRRMKLKSFQKDFKEPSRGSGADIRIVMKKIPDLEVVSLRKVVPDYFSEGEMWKEMTGKLGKCRSLVSESFSLYHDTEYKEEEVDIEICVVWNEKNGAVPRGLVHRQVPGCDHAVSILVKGSYQNISGAYKEFLYWLGKHPEYRMAGPNRQICHVSPADKVAEEEYVTELLIPCHCFADGS